MSTLPGINLSANAKITRKTFERLASFSHLTSVEDSALLKKTVNKINALVKIVDTSMVVAHLGYRLATSVMILCDPEGQEWEADVSFDTLKALTSRGLTASNEVAAGFRDVQQEIYKIAALTKDNTLLVVAPPDPSHADEIKMQLKDVGTGLVANLRLLTDFSRIAQETAEWWSALDEMIKSGASTLLPKTTANGEGGKSPETTEKFEQWSKMKDAFQDYYNIVNVVHVSFPDLLSPSMTAWKAVATAQSIPSSEQSSLIDPRELTGYNDSSSKNSNKGAKESEASKPKALTHFFAKRLHIKSRWSGSKSSDVGKKDEVGRPSSSQPLPDPSTRDSRLTAQTADVSATEASQPHNEGIAQSGIEQKRKRSWFGSCLSSTLFEDLGCQGDPEKSTVPPTTA